MMKAPETIGARAGDGTLLAIRGSAATRLWQTPGMSAKEVTHKQRWVGEMNRRNLS